MNPIAKNATLAAIELRKLGGEKNAMTAAAFDEAAAEIEKLEALRLEAAKVLEEVADGLTKLRGEL